MEQKDWDYKHPLSCLHTKLDPPRFHWISPIMRAVIGHVLGVNYGIPVIEEIVVVYDGAVVARPQGSTKASIIGKYDDLVMGWKCLLSSAGLTTLEWMIAEALFATKIGYLFDAVN